MRLVRQNQRRRMQTCTAGLLLAVLPAALQAQATAAPTPPAPSAQTQSGTAQEKPVKLPTNKERRRATKLYLEASKLFLAAHYEEALSDYQQAAQLDATNADYRMAADVARDHAVMALIQQAAKQRLSGNAAGARAALERAQALDPKNIEVTEHLYELGNDVLQTEPPPLYAQAANTPGNAPALLPATRLHSFHVHTGERELIGQVYKAYGLDAMLDDSVREQMIRLDVDDATFAQATQLLGLVTGTFYVPLDAHRVLVARDTRENREKFMRQELETVYLAGLKPEDLTEVSNLAKNVFGIQQAAADPGADTITLRAPADTLQAFNSTMRGLLAGRNQVMLDIRIVQLAHAGTRNTGVQPPQTVAAYNLYAEEQSILQANQSLVQQIISSGLVSPNDTLTILGILLASGQVSSSLFANGIATFGGGLTASALSPGPLTMNFNLNSSDSRTLDDIQLRLGDGEDATLKEGERYPIQTSSYTSLGSSLSNIPGLSAAGASSGLSSLLSNLSAAVPQVPMIQYQDLGLVLKVTPKVLRSDDVALSIDMKITALSGASVDGNPILDNQAYTGVVTLQRGETAEVASEIDQSESRSISGSPGISEIPGLNNVSANTNQKNYATLLIMITPHIIRETQPAGSTPMIRVVTTTSPL